MQPDEHMLVVKDADERVTIFECLNCTRRVLIDRVERDYVVLEAGDATARHSGVHGPVSLSLSVRQDDR